MSACLGRRPVQVRENCLIDIGPADRSGLRPRRMRPVPLASDPYVPDMVFGAPVLLSTDSNPQPDPHCTYAATDGPFTTSLSSIKPSSPDALTLHGPRWIVTNSYHYASPGGGSTNNPAYTTSPRCFTVPWDVSYRYAPYDSSDSPVPARRRIPSRKRLLPCRCKLPDCLNCSPVPGGRLPSLTFFRVRGPRETPTSIRAAVNLHHHLTVVESRHTWTLIVDKVFCGPDPREFQANS